MKRILLLILTLAITCTGVGMAEGIDIAVMTDEELADLGAKIEAKQTRRQNERSTMTPVVDDGEIIYVHGGSAVPKIIFSSEEQLRGRLHKIELIAENWSRYLGDHYFVYEYVLLQFREPRIYIYIYKQLNPKKEPSFFGRPLLLHGDRGIFAGTLCGGSISGEPIEPTEQLYAHFGSIA